MSTTGQMPSVGRPGEPSAVRSFQFGDVTATYVADGVLAIRPAVFVPDIPATQWSRWPELFDQNGRMLMSAGALLVERRGQQLLIDIGVGPVVSEFPWGSTACGSMLEVLIAARRQLLDELTKPNTFGFGFQFGDCAFGRRAAGR